MTLWPLWSSDGVCTCVCVRMSCMGKGEREICTWRAAHTHTYARIIDVYTYFLLLSSTSQHTCCAAYRPRDFLTHHFSRASECALSGGYIGRRGWRGGEREMDLSRARALIHRDATNWPSNRARHTWERRRMRSGEGGGGKKDVCFSNGRNRWYTRRRSENPNSSLGQPIPRSVRHLSISIPDLAPTWEMHSRRESHRRGSAPESDEYRSLDPGIYMLHPSRWHLTNFHVSRRWRMRTHTYTHPLSHTHTHMSENRAGRSLTCRTNRIRSDS